MGINNQHIVDLLHEIELFSKLDISLLKEFANHMQEVPIKKNEILFNKGDQEHALYIILEGSIQVHDNEYIFTTLNRKQFFGEYSLIDSSLRSATATAVKDSILLKLEQETFINLTKKTPDVWQNMLVTLVKRLRDYNILEEKLTLRTLEIQRKKYEIEQEKESIKDQKKELESINLTKDRFFSIIANDLKSPFSSIQKISNSLSKDYDKLDDEKIREYILQMNKFSNNAFKLLENLLKWAQSQTGSLKINFRRSNLLQLVNEVIDLYESNAYEKSISFQLELDESVYGYFDYDMVTVIFRNLIANAITFSRANSTIGIVVNESNDMLIIEIRDEGIGMDEKVVGQLFKIEHRKDMDITAQTENTGLGLILCKEFVLKNGGEIWAESIKNKGTTIKFTLPKAL